VAWRITTEMWLSATCGSQDIKEKAKENLDELTEQSEEKLEAAKGAGKEKLEQARRTRKRC
jgi:hypothetical protein